MTRSIYFLAVVLLLAGCRKYVEIDQIGKRTLKYTKDYRALLDNTSLLEGSFGLSIYLGDDTRFLDSSKQVAMSDINSNAYTWQEQFWSETQADADWEKLYNVIYHSNVAIDGVMDSETGTTEEKQQLYAEALVHRAYAYWCLVNLYGKQYDNATATTDMAVPLLLSPDLFVNLTRTSVANVYDRIITDLNAALPALPNLPDYNTRPSKAGVYAVLARTYLGMRDFDNARANAEKALALQSTLLDLRTYATSTAGFPYRTADPEVIMSKIATGVYTGIQLDTALLSLLGAKDLRYTLFVKPGGSFSPTFNGYGYWRYRYTREGNVIFQGPRVPEMMLIKAECAARSGDATTAIDLLNTIRQKRFLAADYTALSAGSAAEALALVVNERKREFFGTGLRWLDQKRLNRDAAFAATVTRRFKGVNYTLEPNSNRYIYPIGMKYILLNSELAQSPR